MNGQVFCPPSRERGIDKAMQPEQFKQVVEAILAGKYSWACVLILRFGGYNPLHYIPYTTYNRLLKENCNVKQLNRNHLEHFKNDKTVETTESSEGCLNQLADLGYLELLDQKAKQVQGGSRLSRAFFRF
ncbi:HetP family heterocyst commitment protein [Myxacorys almedinensis]|uniref:HetP family heterocyst commitment protein n=1 Tax=Myxacorys almedinensis A TaxID=2690445 RepID=A0A8J7ZC84_9CYAN|nr:HetP family heterocyst commitment protein [Myxacorys almedinensis]NDJ19290.1 HetP family heterocyst commitment protein [Myxacorys almedinensis A]